MPGLSKTAPVCILLTCRGREGQKEGELTEPEKGKKESQRGEEEVTDSGREEEIEEPERTREATDRCSSGEGTHLGEQVVHVAQAAAFFIEGDEVAGPPTAQRGPGEHHLRGGRPEG